MDSRRRNRRNFRIVFNCLPGGFAKYLSCKYNKKNNPRRDCFYSAVLITTLSIKIGLTGVLVSPCPFAMTFASEILSMTSNPATVCPKTV
jgi:hypothetical protein